MMLLVDIGNTRVKWALADKSDPLGNWRASGAVEHVESAGLARQWQGLGIARVIASNVAGRDHEVGLQSLVPVPVEWFVSAPEAAGVRNRYRDPAQLGCDRFAAAIGARALFPSRDLIIANCGTATTVDALTADGVFIGGMILPGWRLMTEALARKTARLPLVSEKEAASASCFADNTDDAIRSGCLAAQAGAIAFAFAEHAKRYGEVHCIVSGGGAGMIAPHLRVPYVEVENVVLIGLQAYAAHHPPARMP
jgi:type III pantothenate kinase